jgi:hypothetical protein
MSTALKCPNPSCPYLFDPSRVPAGVVLTCPRCGMRFTLGAPTPPAASSAPPTPPAPPQTAGDPAFEDMAADSQPGRATPIRRSAPVRETGPVQTLVLVVIGLALMGGIGAMVYFRLVDKPRRGGGSSDAPLREYNLAFVPPPSPWVQDDDVRVKLGSPILLAYRQPQPEAFMAFGAKDYQDREPRTSELRAGLNGPLDRLFEDIARTDIPDARWLGQPAIGFSFHARHKDGPVVDGVCYATGHKGVGYWAIFWAGEGDAKEQVGAFEKERVKIKLAGLRGDWAAKRAPVRSFRGHAAGYEVIDAEDIWKEPEEKDRPAAGEDPKGDLLLVAKVKQRGRDIPEEATLLVMVLDSPAGDPLPAGRKYVEDQWTARVKESGGTFTTKFTELTDKPEGDPAADGVDQTAPVIRLKGEVPGARSQTRLMVISAAAIDGKLVVASAWCPWADREAFEGRLVQMVGSLRKAE